MRFPEVSVVFAAAANSLRSLIVHTVCPAALAGLVLIALTGASPTLAAERLVEGIAAQVGGEIILVSEVMEMAGPVEERMRAAGAPEQEVARLRTEALERLIEGKLLTSVVERLELGAEREEIDGAIAAIAEDNGITQQELLDSIASHGLSIDEYRAKIQGEIERSKVVNAMVRSRVQIRDDEVRTLFDQQFADQPEGGEEVYLRHIVVTPQGSKAANNAEACALVGEARKRIASGELEFGAVAQRVTDMNPERAGELGWIHRKDLASWMSKRVETMQPGELSEVIEMPFGCNLLQLVERRDYRPISYEEAEPQLRNALFQQKTEEEYVKWLDILRGQTHIERKGPFGG
jgi:peptidyl-prolyl cis-trans isomerase SurA